MITYIIAAEYIALDPSKGEVLVFRRGHKSTSTSEKALRGDEESGQTAPGDQNIQDDHETTDHEGGHQPRLVKQESIFHWQDVCYDIKIKGKPRRILDHVDGWVKPGTLTALMV